MSKLEQTYFFSYFGIIGKSIGLMTLSERAQYYVVVGQDLIGNKLEGKIEVNSNSEEITFSFQIIIAIQNGPDQPFGIKKKKDNNKDFKMKFPPAFGCGVPQETKLESGSFWLSVMPNRSLWFEEGYLP